MVITKGEVPKLARKLRSGDPDNPQYQELLAEFFKAREEFIEWRGKGSQYVDAIAISPMPVRPAWEDDGPSIRQYDAAMTKQDRATRKGRRVEARRRSKRAKSVVADLIAVVVVRSD